MLTDVFSNRYLNVPIWTTFGEPERRLLVQTFRILKEQLFSYYDSSGNETLPMKAVWTDLHPRISMELGLPSLSPLVYGYYSPTKQWISGTYTIVKVCETWMLRDRTSSESADTYVKERLSLIELGFRTRDEQLATVNQHLPTAIENARLRASRKIPGTLQLPGDPAAGVRESNKKLNDTFRQLVDELNTRFRQAGCSLHYHNGFIQRSEDSLVLSTVEQPFWNIVAAPKWKNVDIDMKEAVDRRDEGTRDPAFYAARALESTIKIISDEKGWTHGGERGAHNYIDNLLSSKAKFIELWEAESLKIFFSKIRNPMGHGAGSSEMITLSTYQESWAIEFCMSWIKGLALRM
ncbi:AbiJ-NTD4 domain-containing protein [Bradyrhizobium roseum]|uniref:AbiJ-NTD4 domain-containing protein n=1 Tax=Bradyrhizobium roseum TaxID=3056648 RepID=UPI002612B640|nr:hypothetical protein [Bradyrhizobium roseus]WKA29811.1 hypothetical protein QUH67_06450 [Bradyrhizobium roseus]